MNSNPLVSVIIPTCNRGDLLSRSIDSVLCQTYQNLELIIVDDASQDNTQEIVKGYAEKDKRLIVVKNGRKLGKAGALNVGIGCSHGEFISFLDDDCEFLPAKIDRGIAAMGAFSPAPSIIISNGWIEKINGRTILSEELASKLLTQENIFNCKYSSGDPSCWFCRRSSVQKLRGFKSNLKLLEDVDFFFRAFLNKHPIYFLNEPLTIKHRGDGMSSISLAYLRKREEFFVENFYFLKKHKKYCSRFLYCLGKDYLRLREKKKAKHYFWQAFLCDPLKVEYFVKMIMY